jgi:hypothetical protein
VRKLFLIALATLLLGVSIIGFGAIPVQAAIGITVSPGSGNSTIIVIGNEFPTGGYTVTLYWDAEAVPLPTFPAVISTIDAGDFAYFEAIINMPEGAAPGLHNVTARIIDTNYTASTTFTVLNTIGTRGSSGASGAMGATGPQGITGPQGAAGANGDTGAKGDTGLKGDTGTKGDTGLKGDTGIQGLQGVQGPPGPVGTTGTVLGIVAVVLTLLTIALLLLGKIKKWILG